VAITPPSRTSTGGVSIIARSSRSRSSAVVIFLIFALAAILAAYDLFWWFVLRAIQGSR
jgi:hypothetical protein